MNRSAHIDNVIAQRHPLAQRIEAVAKNLEALSSIVSRCEEYHVFLKAREDASVSTLPEQVDWSAIRISIKSERDSLDKLKARFSRDTLNIGVVGRARQGKSRLLQSLTQLTRAEIPDGDRQHCTGVRSTICHKPDLSPNETYAEVSFYSAQSFLQDVLTPYYQELKLGEVPKSLGAFANQPLSKLPNHFQDYAEPKAKYEYLNRYRSRYTEYSGLLTEYSGLLQATESLRISRADIRKYVAQDDLNGDRIFFNYLAVREVKIFCPFPNQEVQKIALVDMPGLGDTGIGDEPRLVQALGQEVDAVLFVRMPKSTGDSWFDVDVRLYDTAYGALEELPIHLWSFMVLNRTDGNSKNGDNLKNCEDLQKSINENHITVQECAVIDCSKSGDALRLLDRVIDYLSTHITQLDTQYAESRQRQLLQLQKNITSEISKARQVVGFDPKGSLLRKNCFNQFWDELTFELVKFRKEIQQNIGKDDSAFKNKVDEVIRKCRNDSGIPSDASLINQGEAREGSYTEIYAKYLHKLRTDLSKHFLSLDGEIQQSLEEVKTKLGRVLIQQVGLKLIDSQEQKPLQAIAHQIRQSNARGGNLELGFQTLADFNVSFAGIIQRQLRLYLDELHPDRNLLQSMPTLPVEELLSIARLVSSSSVFGSFIAEFQSPTGTQLMGYLQMVISSLGVLTPDQQQALQKLNMGLDGTQVLERLQNLHQQVVEHCENVLRESLKEPNQIAYAMVAEFVDRVLRASRHRPGDVRDEWEIFLDEVGEKIWPQLRQLSDRAQEQEEWVRRLEQLEVANQIKGYHFLEGS